MVKPLLPAWIPERYCGRTLLGEGGFGRVILAEDRELARRVAIKVLRDFLPDDQARMRFLREARLTGSLTHPHLVRIFDSQCDPQGRCFLVYEYVPGPSLAEVWIEHGPLETARATDLFVRLGEALDSLHQSGIIHRDIKPGNILMRGESDPVLCDLGLAQRAEDGSKLTATGVLMGTPIFMAPELWSGAKASPASDQFALAASMFLVLTGETVFPGGEIPDILAFLESGAPLGHGPASEALPGRVRASLRRALHRLPTRRFPDLAAFATALREATPASSSLPGATRVVRAAVPAEPPTPDGVRRPSSAPRHWRALLGILVVGLLWSLLARRHDSTASAPAPATAPAVGPTPSEPRPLDRMLQRAGYPDEAFPAIGLEALFRRDTTRSERLVGELTSLAAAERPHGLADPVPYLMVLTTWEQWEQPGSAPSVRAASEAWIKARQRATAWDSPPEDLWEARTRIELLWAERTMQPSAGAAPDLTPAQQARLAALDAHLEARHHPDWSALRAIFWERLGLGLYNQALLALPALERSLELAGTLLHEEAPLDPEIRLAFLLSLVRACARLGDVHRARILVEDLGPTALSALHSEDLRDYWMRRLRQDLPATEEQTSQPGFDLGAIGTTLGTELVEGLAGRNSAEAPGLRLPLETPGSDPRRIRSPVAWVPDPPATTVDLDGSSWDSFLVQERRATRVGSQIRVPGSWITEVLLPRLRTRDPVAEDVAHHRPELLVALVHLSESVLGREIRRRLLREARRGLARHNPLRRTLFRPPWSTLRGARLEAQGARPSSAGPTSDADWVHRTLGKELARLPPPWCFGEIELGFRLWQHTWTRTHHPQARRETIRLGLRLLEGAVSRGQGPGEGDRTQLVVQVLRDLLRLPEPPDASEWIATVPFQDTYQATRGGAGVERARLEAVATSLGMAAP